MNSVVAVFLLMRPTLLILEPRNEYLSTNINILIYIYLSLVLFCLGSFQRMENGIRLEAGNLRKRIAYYTIVSDQRIIFIPFGLEEEEHVDVSSRMLDYNKTNRDVIIKNTGEGLQRET